MQLKVEKHYVFEPERLILSAQAEGLGNGDLVELALKGPFMRRIGDRERPLQGRCRCDRLYPGLRPGLIE